ncbi:hypothetical protein BJ138DRAFT_1111966 [Hygrophoropsis aurantiaca]|uniref:Uncharacterized protein n=1 Tax=Hygrophoropsis aurantiaca TaxID=72124 RepID=A0ACB8AIV4_9AGAM|nr:hypothetical protein BJ138DRAFT_1111966 [Hygrophoropsis aurantiaca]
MLIRLSPASSHPTVLYRVTFPTHVPNLPVPPAWSAQLHLITSILHFQAPANIHVLDQSAWLVVVIDEVHFDLPSRVIDVNFIDGSSMTLEIVTWRRIVVREADVLLGALSAAPTKFSPLPDLLNQPGTKNSAPFFSLSSRKSLIPRPLPPAPPPTPTVPPLTPLPQLPQVPIPPRPDPHRLRQRARATLVDAWRLHVLSSLGEQAPSAGYAEWAIHSFERRLRSEVRAFKVAEHAKNGPRREGRKALDLGERPQGPERRWRSPSPFPERVDQSTGADEWGVRRSCDSDVELDAFEFELAGESLLDEKFGVDAIDFDDFLGFRDDSYVFGSEDEADGLDQGAHRGLDALLEAETEDDGDDSEESEELRTPEEGEILPLPCPPTLSNLTGATDASSYVARTPSSRPRARPPVSSSSRRGGASGPQESAESSSFRPADHQFHGAIATSASQRTHVPTHLAQLATRLRDALVIVRSRACQEGWAVIRCSHPGHVMDESEKLLENKARRRAWSAGIQIAESGVRKVNRITFTTEKVRVWDGSLPTPLFRDGGPIVPPGLALPAKMRVLTPITPPGLNLGRPMRSSPLARFVYTAADLKAECDLDENWRYGTLGLCHANGQHASRRPVRMSVTVHQESRNMELFPVSEEPELYEDEIANQSFYDHEHMRVHFPADTPSSPTSDADEQDDDPFFYSPFRTRTRTTSMYAQGSTSLPTLPMFRPSTPPPSYQATVHGNAVAPKLDASALLFQPLSSFRTQPPSEPRPPLVSNPPFIPAARARANSLPSSAQCQDLSQVYAAPPPSSPPGTNTCVTSAPSTPTYAHVHTPVPMCPQKSIESKKKEAEMVFKHGNEEFTLGIEVALGRAEEGRAVPVGW